MNTKHTPGPWRLVANGTYVQASREHAVNPQQQHDIDICHIAGKHETFAGEMDANARLIAAAPDLLAALRALTDWGCEHTSPRDANSPHELLVAARAAIAKAEGL